MVTRLFDERSRTWCESSIRKRKEKIAYSECPKETSQQYNGMERDEINIVANSVNFRFVMYRCGRKTTSKSHSEGVNTMEWSLKDEMEKGTEEKE